MSQNQRDNDLWVQWKQSSGTEVAYKSWPPRRQDLVTVFVGKTVYLTTHWLADVKKRNKEKILS